MEMAKRGYKLQEFVAHASNVKCLNIGKKSCRVFITGSEDHKVNLWAIGQPTPLLSLSGHTTPVESLTFNSAEVLVLAGASSGIIKLWDLEEGKTVRTLTGHRSSCTSVEFHPFGEFFASGSLDTDLKIWDIRRKGCIHTYKGHTRGIRTIRFTPDGRWIVSGGEDNTVKLWDLTAGKLLHEFKFHTGLIRSIDFHPNEFLLATGSADRTVKFWDLETFELIGSAGPEATGVRSMIFHPDGRTLFCGLDETLKVFSWEPVRCHDVVHMGWSTLGDLSIYEGKLLGCSYHQSCVRVWVADISLIGPYAVGVMPRSNGLMEPLFNPGENHSIQQIGSSIKFNTGAQDCSSETKETITNLHVTSDESNQSALQSIGSTYASKATSTNSTRRGNKGSLSCHSAPQKNDLNLASEVSTRNMTVLRESKSTESSPSTPRRIESSSVSKGNPLNSTGFCGNSLSNLKKDPMIEVHSGTHVQMTNKPISMPVIVPRDNPVPDLSNAANSQKETATIETTICDTVLYEPTQMRKLSYVDVGTESQAIADESGLSNGVSKYLVSVMDSNFLSRLAVNGGTVDAIEGNSATIGRVAEKFERAMSLEQPLDSQNIRYADSLCSSSETCSVKYVKGVAVQAGRTRSLVESWERRERGNNSCNTAIGSSSETLSAPDNLPHIPEGKSQTSGRELTSVDDVSTPEALLQNHDLFINVLKSRLTKLQVVRHFWEQNGIKGAINAVAKLPDHSVQVDVISILMEKIDLFSLDLFSCLLPLLAGLLGSKKERHTNLSLEMLLKLTKVFGPVIRSTMSASSLVGVDIQAEQRLERCRQCFSQLENIKQILPSLIRRGGLLAKYALELNFALQE